ncbi:hypothetical protein C5F49_05505 [Nitrosopumilus oxyclinae]|uniref:Uncharacterized protein n=1 Tax=Nitrosopumilus oxyclinae TaxID=1959104 RepID=A0A7D5M562_9ARCH|nr:hypothetical protein [Nitrosopumilus oxyclinae]QLH04830.1 hypothetical protein C5F49_05505 [Nitrosopumilus oxyclinae]
MSFRTILESLRLHYLVWWVPIHAEEHEKGITISAGLALSGVILFYIPALILFFSSEIIGGIKNSVLPDWVLSILTIMLFLSFPMTIIGYLLYRDALGHHNSNDFRDKNKE